MKNFIILALILMMFASCQEKHADYQLRILIRNGTDSIITVNLYPKSEYIKYGKYSFSDMHLNLKDVTFEPESRLGTEIYSTHELSIEPQMLATKVFDSIDVSFSSGKLIRFSPQKVTNYSQNMFSDRSVWIYEKNSFEHIKMWRDRYVESDDYIFVISIGN